MTGKIKLVHSGGNAVSLAVPTNNPSASEVELKLPQSDGSADTFLKTDGSGNLSFAEAGGGKILQVQSTTRTDTFSESLATGTLSADALTVNITPSNASNKIFLIAHVSMGLNNDNEVNWVFYKAGSLLTGAAGTSAGNRKPRTSAGDVRWVGTHNTTGGQYLDTAGGTSQITYSVKLGHSANGTKTVYLNRSHTDDNYAYDVRTLSTLTAMEVEA